MTNTVRVAVLSAAHVHADGYLANLRAIPGVELAGLWDDDAARGLATAGRHDTTLHDTEASLLASGVDAGVIASVNSEHRRLVELAATAGVDVLCEKPLATRVDDARAIV